MFTAHIDENNKERKQTVKEHSIGVAKLAREYSEALNLRKTSELQSLLHDAGKLCRDFDNYINDRNNFKRGEIDHAFAGAKFLSELTQNNTNTSQRIIAGYVSRTVVSHHGLHDWVDNLGKDYFEKRISENKRYNEICDNLPEILSKEEAVELLKLSADEYSEYHKMLKSLSHNDPEKFLFYSGLFERLLQSILVDADRTDTASFMFGKPTENRIDVKSVWENAGRNLSERYREYSKRTDVISVQRTKIADKCLKFAANDVGICRLIVPTGGGKTLSSLRFAVEYARLHNKSHIFYIAPFMSILEQNSDVIKEVIGEDNFLEHYSDFMNSINDKDELERFELRSEKWDVPVIATTLVQFMNTIYSNKMQSVRRFHRLSNSVIILDEVQAVPLKCVNLFNLAVNFLAKICGATVVLCTATQPALDKTDYPIELDKCSEMNPDYKEDFEIFHRVDLHSACRINGYTFEETADFCAGKFEENGNLLLVVNTRAAAREIFNILNERFNSKNVKIMHLSTEMCPEHRRDVIRSIRCGLEKSLPIICVTTQLIEAGVDISFKCVVRSLAGLDNAAQAAGRCNRNGEYSLCQAYVINIIDEKLKHLPEIEHRCDAARSTIEKYKDSNLLNVDVMDDYFTRFYHERKNEMSYDVSEYDTTLVKLLSYNDTWIKGRKNLVELIGTQAFKTTGAMFNMFDNNTDDIIVPYNDDAKELILALISESGLYYQSQKLRLAQKYSVSVFSYQKSILLDKNAIFLLPCGTYALKDEFYDSKGIGLNFRGGEMEVLDF